MGKVFTADAMRSGKVPDLNGFREVIQWLHELSSQEWVALALLFGSVHRGDATRRSDVDCLLVYEPSAQTEACERMHQLVRSANGLYVPLTFVPCDTALAKTRMHAMGPSFRKHLGRCASAGGLIKGSLEDIFAPSVGPREEIESYIRAKMYRLQESFVASAAFSAESEAAFLKKVFEAPMHVARKVLEHRGMLGGDSKLQVLERYRECMPQNLARLLEQLCALDAAYTAEVERQLKAFDGERYERAFAVLKAAVPAALAFLQLNVFHIDEARQ